MSVIGKTLGHYEITSQLGKGGMGEVYQAKDLKLGRQAALKTLPALFAGDHERLRRFTQEARSASALNHPNIVTIYEIVESGQWYCIAEELIEGETLRQRLAHTRMTISEVLEMGLQIASALTAAHEAGITHRDIKPENVMLRHDGLVKVLDFGLAKLTPHEAPQLATETMIQEQSSTATGMVMGTPRYMSPEQARGVKIDARTDIFSLGVVLYEMVAGRRPFEGATTNDVLAALLAKEPAPLQHYCPAVPTELQRIISHALAKEPEERYQTIKDLGLDLKHLKQELEYEQKKRASGDYDEAATTQTSSSAEYLVNEVKHHKVWTIGILLSLVLAVLSALYFARGNDAINSLAVLPLLNVSADANVDYLSDGITEGIINSLSQLPKLRVMARTTAFAYKGKNIDPRQVGRDLKVRAVFTGRVTLLANTLSVQADLVDTEKGSQLWGARYDRKLDDLQMVQEDIAKQISENLRLQLTGEERKRVTKRYTENSVAYQLYLKGHYIMMNSYTGDEWKKGLEYFNQAIRLDPTFALAYEGLAECYCSFSNTNWAPKEAMPKAKAAAVRALELDDSLAEAHSVLGMVSSRYDFDWVTGEREYKRAIALNPGSAPVHVWYAQDLACQARFNEALFAANQSIHLDPLSSINAVFGAVPFLYLRQYDQAIIRLQKVIEADSNFYPAYAHLGIACEQQGRLTQAITYFQKARQLENFPWTSARLGHAYAVAGRRAEATKILDDLKESAKHKYVSPWAIALIYTGLGEKDQAFEWLEKGYEARDEQLTALKVDLPFDSLRSDPRFIDLLRRLHLSP
jgi:eukaryotic-like serine/threonine-protein kinase